MKLPECLPLFALLPQGSSEISTPTESTSAEPESQDVAAVPASDWISLFNAINVDGWHSYNETAPGLPGMSKLALSLSILFGATLEYPVTVLERLVSVSVPGLLLATSELLHVFTTVFVWTRDSMLTAILPSVLLQSARFAV